MKRTSRQARLLPNLEPIRDGDGLTIGDLTTRRAAEALLFDVPSNIKGVTTNDTLKPMTTSPSPTRRRVQPLYCPSCSSWVDVELQPIRLRCSGCGAEAMP